MDIEKRQIKHNGYKTNESMDPNIHRRKVLHRTEHQRWRKKKKGKQAESTSSRASKEKNRSITPVMNALPRQDKEKRTELIIIIHRVVPI